MKQPVIFISFLFFSLMLRAQDSLKTVPNFKNEVGIAFRSDITFSYFQLAHLPLDNYDLPDFFPKMEQLNEMSNTPENYFSNNSGGLCYTRWSDYRGKKNKTKYGLYFQFGVNDGVYFYDHWSVETRTTFDSVVSQSSGTTYPVDSVFHQFYDRETKMDFLQLGIGGNISHRLNNYLDLQFGLKGIVDNGIFENTNVKYSTLTTIETYGQQYEVSKESAVLQLETNRETISKLFSMSISTPILLSFRFKFLMNEKRNPVMEERRRRIREMKGREEKKYEYVFKLGVEPVLTMVSMNSTFYCKPAFLFSFGTVMLF